MTGLWQIMIWGFVATLCLAGCCESHVNEDAMNRAEALMMEFPDSSLMLLEGIDVASLRTERNVARHAVLLSQAYDKNYIDLTDDSLVTIAVDYFSDKDNDRYYAMLSHYYHARVKLNAGNVAGGIISCMEAEELALAVGDDFYLGLIYGTLADASNDGYNFKDELRFSQLSMEHFNRTGIEPYLRFAHLGYATALSNVYDYEASDSVLCSLASTEEYRSDTLFLRELYRQFSIVKSCKKEKTTAKNMLLYVMNGLKQPLEARGYGRLAKMYVDEGKLDSARYYIGLGNRISGTSRDRYQILYAQYRLYMHERDYNSVSLIESRLIEADNDMTSSLWKQSIVNAQRDYFSHKANKAKMEIATQRKYLIAIIIVSLLVIIVLAGYVRYRRKRAELKIDNLKRILDEQAKISDEYIADNMLKINELQQDLLSINTENDELKEKLELQQRLLDIENERAKYERDRRDFIEREVKTSPLVLRIREQIKNERILTANDFDEIIEFVNEKYPDFEKKIYDIVKLSEHEYRVCLLLKCGMNPSEISRLVGRGSSSITNTRKRLYKKIFNEEGRAEDLDMFIREL